MFDPRHELTDHGLNGMHPDLRRVERVFDGGLRVFAFVLDASVRIGGLLRAAFGHRHIHCFHFPFLPGGRRADQASMLPRRGLLPGAGDPPAVAPAG